jgi:hypothetical protein
MLKGSLFRPGKSLWLLLVAAEVTSMMWMEAIFGKDVPRRPHDCPLRRNSELRILACTIHHIQGCQRHPVVAPETQGKEAAEEQLLEKRLG